jgi:hypothetical protein
MEQGVVVLRQRSRRMNIMRKTRRTMVLLAATVVAVAAMLSSGLHGQEAGDAIVYYQVTYSNGKVKDIGQPPSTNKDITGVLRIAELGGDSTGARVLSTGEPAEELVNMGRTIRTSMEWNGSAWVCCQLAPRETQAQAAGSTTLGSGTGNQDSPTGGAPAELPSNISVYVNAPDGPMPQSPNPAAGAIPSNGATASPAHPAGATGPARSTHPAPHSRPAADSRPWAHSQPGVQASRPWRHHS